MQLLDEYTSAFTKEQGKPRLMEYLQKLPAEGTAPLSWRTARGAHSEAKISHLQINIYTWLTCPDVPAD